MKTAIKIVMGMLVVMVLGLMGCGGGGGGDSSSPDGGSTATYKVSGAVTFGGAGLAGVTVSTQGGSATTIASGEYTISGLANGTYTLNPVKTGYTFTPATVAVTVNNANVTGKNFTATTSGGGVTGVVKLPKTGATTSYGTRDDGALQKGVAWPNPRFTDNGNGSVTDNLTGLIWLKNANCFGEQTWAAALTNSNTLASGTCSLRDGSTAGQWRLPNITELESLVDAEHYSPALPSNHPFTGVQSGKDSNYWSSSSYADFTDAWIVWMGDGHVEGKSKSSTSKEYVWPVRAGQ